MTLQVRYLGVDEGVEGSTAWEDDEREAGCDRKHEAQLDGLTEDGRSEVHEHITRYVLVTEGDVTKVAHLSVYEDKE